MGDKCVQEVLDELALIIPKNKAVRIKDVYKKLGIFDWWSDNLAISRQKEMRSFLRTARELGYVGTVEFQVGISGCANGMWAFKEKFPTSNPEVLYKSFTPEYVGWDVCDKNGCWTAYSYNSIKTIKEIKKIVNEKKKAGEISV